MPRLHRSLLRRYRLFAPRLLRLGLLLLALLLLGDGFAALRTPQIQAALALSTSTPQQSGISLVAAPMGGSQIVLASDTFQRTDQAYWGKSSSGQNWLEDAQTDRNFAVSHASGLINAASAC
ncbi:MAG: hypothetical protein ACRDHW_23720, partial [Ktedonobacteraceae bacterium]